MNERPVRLGPLALLLSVIGICLAVLSILTWSTAAADLRLARRYADTVSVRAALQTEGQQILADAEDAVKEGMPLTILDGAVPQPDGSVRIEREQEGYRLIIELTETDGRCEILRRAVHREWTPDESMGNLWNGFPGMGGL